MCIYFAIIINKMICFVATGKLFIRIQFLCKRFPARLVNTAVLSDFFLRIFEYFTDIVVSSVYRSIRVRSKYNVLVLGCNALAP